MASDLTVWIKVIWYFLIHAVLPAYLALFLAGILIRLKGKDNDQSL